MVLDRPRGLGCGRTSWLGRVVSESPGRASGTRIGPWPDVGPGSRRLGDARLHESTRNRPWRDVGPRCVSSRGCSVARVDPERAVAGCPAPVRVVSGTPGRPTGPGTGHGRLSGLGRCRLGRSSARVDSDRAVTGCPASVRVVSGTLVCPSRLGSGRDGVSGPGPCRLEDARVRERIQDGLRRKVRPRFVAPRARRAPGWTGGPDSASAPVRVVSAGGGRPTGWRSTYRPCRGDRAGPEPAPERGQAARACSLRRPGDPARSAAASTSVISPGVHSAQRTTRSSGEDSSAPERSRTTASVPQLAHSIMRVPYVRPPTSPGSRSAGPGIRSGHRDSAARRHPARRRPIRPAPPEEGRVGAVPHP